MVRDVYAGDESGDTPPTNLKKYCFNIIADTDPSVLQRVAQQVALNGITPQVFRCEQAGDQLLICVELTQLSPERADLIQRKLIQLFFVTRVELVPGGG